MMAYHVDYSSQNQLNHSGSGIRRIMMTISFFLCFLLLVNTFWPEGSTLLRNLLPGDPENALLAAEVFAGELESGFSIIDAAKNFCTAILHHERGV